MTRNSAPYEGSQRKQLVDVVRDGVTRKEIRVVGSNKTAQKPARKPPGNRRKVANGALHQILETSDHHTFPGHLQHLLVSSLDIPEQLIELSADTTPNPNSVQPVKNRPFSNKPHGGMWTATRTGQVSSAWSDWRESEDYDQHENVRMWKMQNPQEGNLIKIDSQENFLSLIETFPAQQTDDMAAFKIDTTGLDYEKLAATGVDGIWLTAEGEQATRHSTNGSDLYGWDFECVLWFKVPETASFENLSDST